MEFVTSLGGPRILIPTKQVPDWEEGLDDIPDPDEGLYGLACEISEYCGVIQPWNFPILIFGDDPSDIYWFPAENGGLFVRWVGADSLEDLISAVKDSSSERQYEELIECDLLEGQYTLMDSCTFKGDDAPRISLDLSPGKYEIHSYYVENSSVMTIISNLRLRR